MTLFGSNITNMLGLGNMYNMNMGSGNFLSSIMGGGGIFGGLGGFGGLSGFGGVGNSCSLFTDCKGNINYDALAGFGIANSLLNLGTQFLGFSIKNTQENSIDAWEDKYEKAEKDVSDKLNELGAGLSEVDYTKAKPADRFENAIKDAETKVTDLKQSIARLEKPSKPAKPTEGETAEYEKSINEYNKSLANYEVEKAKIEDLLKKAKEELEKAENAKNAEEERIKGLITKIDNLIKTRDEVKKELDRKKLDKADGYIFQRADKEDVEKLFGQDGNLKKDAKVKKSHLRYLITAYATAIDDAVKKDIAKKFYAIYDELDANDLTGNIEYARDVIPKPEQTK